MSLTAEMMEVLTTLAEHAAENAAAKAVALFNEAFCAKMNEYMATHLRIHAAECPTKQKVDRAQWTSKGLIAGLVLASALGGGVAGGGLAYLFGLVGG